MLDPRRTSHIKSLVAIRYARATVLTFDETKMEEPTQPWYTVKCVFSHPSRAKEGDGNLYEERITLWKAESWNDAFRKAEKEAKEAEDCIFNEATDAFHLFDDEVKNGTEIWSGMRGSHLDADTYIKTFCMTGRERMSPLKEND